MIVLAFLSFGFTEIVVVGVVALLVFGGELPDVLRNLGRSYAKLRRSLSDLSRPVRNELRQIRDLPDRPPPADVHASDPNADTYEYPDLEDPQLGPHEEENVDVKPGGGTSMGGAADEPPPV